MTRQLGWFFVHKWQELVGVVITVTTVTFQIWIKLWESGGRTVNILENSLLKKQTRFSGRKNFRYEIPVLTRPFLRECQTPTSRALPMANGSYPRLL
mmetsp:Transcript_32523/g.37257  ORF Transcript_32523/g.37257 Transcript_32523/m.37257 type:complete len:97 (-) Transcript_32523:1756-2046(-)